jgi:hypothetical protein
MALPLDEAEAQFWGLAAAHLEADDVLEGTMMGSRCLRVDGEFTAMIHSKTGELIVKLAADQVSDLVEAGTVLPFAPNGRVFKEWALVPTTDEASWTTLIAQAVDFARGSSTPS